MSRKERILYWLFSLFIAILLSCYVRCYVVEKGHGQPRHTTIKKVGSR